MKNYNDYHLGILKGLIDHQVRFIVCGGVAAVLHGVERMTIDLDLSLDMTDENLQRFLLVMKHENMIPRAPIPAESILDRNLLRLFVQEKGAIVFTFVDPDHPYKQIDLFLTDETSYTTLIDDTVSVQLNPEYAIRILTIPRLLRMKLAVVPLREKDLHDITALKKLQENNHAV